MKIQLPTITSQKIRFSQRFQNLNYVYGSNGIVSGDIEVNNNLDVSGGGYIKYNSMGADVIWNLTQWTVCVECNVLADSTTRTVVACGDAVLGDCFELGVYSDNKMYFDSGSTIKSDIALSAGRHILLWVFDGSKIEFWDNGERIGSATASLNTNNSQSVAS